MRTDSLFTTVELLDLALSRFDCPKTKLQVLSCAALMICAKGDEPRSPPPATFTALSRNAFTVPELTQTEEDIFKLLNCQVSPIHSSHFMKRFLRLLPASTRLAMIAHFVNETALLDERLIGIVPSLRAAAVVALAVALDKGTTEWGDNMRENTGYSAMEVQPVISLLLASVRRFNASRFKAIHKKYAAEALCSVSELDFPETIQLR
jgi:hypothetical protein